MKAKEKNERLIFTKTYFDNLKPLVLSNLIFALPLLVSAGIAFLVSYLAGQMNLFIMLLPVVIFYPFYSGITQVTKELSAGNQVLSPWKTFKKGVKNNWKLFAIHGVILYLVTIITFFAVTMYWVAAQANGIMYFLFGLSVIIGVLLLFTVYYVPIITVSVDISFKHIYKNAFLLAMGELPTNVVVTLMLGVVVVIICAVTFNFAPLVAAIVLLLLAILVFPSTVSLIINTRLYRKITQLFTDQKPHHTESSHNDDGQEFDPSKVPQEVIDKVSSSAAGENDYVFYNGRMIKKSQLQQMINSAEKAVPENESEQKQDE